MNDRYTNYPQDRDTHHHHHHAPTSRAPSYSLPSYPSVPPKQIPHHHHHHHHHSPSSSSTSPGITDATPIRYSGYAQGPPSLSTSSISSSSYAGSADGENGDGDVDLVALLTERLAGAFDPLQLDRSLAVQAQTSGMLNSKTRELIALQEEAQARLAETRRCFLEGMKVAKEVKSDLDYVHRKVKVLKQKTQRKYPVEYDMARDRIPPTTQ